MLACAEARESQAGAMPVLRIGGTGFVKSCDRAATVLQLFPHVAERKPGRCESGLKLDRLYKEIGCAGQIAAGFEVARDLVPAVRGQVAR
jgi:hypothetical protein